MIRNLTFATLASYAAGGITAGVSLGSSWLLHVNRAGFPVWAMLLPAWGLLCAAVVLRWMEHHSRKDVSAFYARLAWASIAGAACWSRVGWLGRWRGSSLLAVADVAVAVLMVLAVLLALVALANVRSASSDPLVRAVTSGILGTTGAVITYCIFDIATGLAYRLPPAAAGAVALVTLVGVPAAALAAGFKLPHH